MEQKATIYNFSKGIRQTKKELRIISIIVIIILIAFLLLSPMTRNSNPADIVTIGFFLFVVIGVISYFSVSRTLRELSELSVRIFPDRVERDGSKEKEVFFWKDIVRADILEYPSGETTSIKLNFAGKKAILLFGFEDMESARNQITQYVPDKGSIRTKRTKINSDNPIKPILLFFSFLFPLLVILIIQEISSIVAFRLFIVIFMFAQGLYTWIARPISISQGKGSEKFETVMGILLIVCSILNLITQLVLK